MKGSTTVNSPGKQEFTGIVLEFYQNLIPVNRISVKFDFLSMYKLMIFRGS